MNQIQRFFEDLRQKRVAFIGTGVSQTELISVFRKKGIGYKQLERQAGESKWSTRALMHLALNGIMSYTTAPLRLASVLGLIVSFVAFLYLIYIIVITNLYGEPVQGYPTMMVTILFLGGHPG